MKLETDKYDRFSKVFTELSAESQDKLVKIAHRLLKIHQFTKFKTAEQIGNLQKVDCYTGK